MLGEGADEGILEEVVWVTSVKEVGFEEDGVAEEVGSVCADSAYARELAVRETLASVKGVAALESEVIVAIRGFGVEVNPQCAVRIKVNHCVEEGEMGGGYFEGEFDGGVAGVEVVDEGKEGHEAMLPNKEDVVYEPFPQEGEKHVHVGDCIVGSGSGDHSSTTCLEEVTTREGEIVTPE